jgi:hypothetical protein
MRSLISSLISEALIAILSFLIRPMAKHFVSPYGDNF